MLKYKVDPVRRSEVVSLYRIYSEEGTVCFAPLPKAQWIANCLNEAKSIPKNCKMCKVGYFTPTKAPTEFCSGDCEVIWFAENKL